MVELTSQIHPDVTSVGTWGMMLQIEKERATEGRSRQWPSETGGEDTFRQIKEVVAAAQESNQHLFEAHEAVASLMHRDPTSVDTWRILRELESQEASGGGTDQGPLEQVDEETRRQIEKAVAQARASRQRLHEADDALERLILPEKRRLQRNMTEAINRVLALVHDLGQ